MNRCLLDKGLLNSGFKSLNQRNSCYYMVTCLVIMKCLEKQFKIGKGNEVQVRTKVFPGILKSVLEHKLTNRSYFFMTTFWFSV